MYFIDCFNFCSCCWILYFCTVCMCYLFLLCFIYQNNQCRYRTEATRKSPKFFEASQPNVTSSNVQKSIHTSISFACLSLRVVGGLELDWSWTGAGLEPGWNPCWHWAWGRVHPGQVSSQPQGWHIEAENNSRSHSHLQDIANLPNLHVHGPWTCRLGIQRKPTQAWRENANILATAPPSRL